MTSHYQLKINSFDFKKDPSGEEYEVLNQEMTVKDHRVVQGIRVKWMKGLCN